MVKCFAVSFLWLMLLTTGACAQFSQGLYVGGEFAVQAGSGAQVKGNFNRDFTMVNGKVEGEVLVSRAWAYGIKGIGKINRFWGIAGGLLKTERIVVHDWDENTGLDVPQNTTAYLTIQRAEYLEIPLGVRFCYLGNIFGPEYFAEIGIVAAKRISGSQFIRPYADAMKGIASGPEIHPIESDMRQLQWKPYSEIGFQQRLRWRWRLNYSFVTDFSLTSPYKKQYAAKYSPVGNTQFYYGVKVSLLYYLGRLTEERKQDYWLQR